MEIKPTNRKPLGKMSKKLEKNFSTQLAGTDINLKEVDSMLSEKEHSFKKKFWDLGKMESLVHSDPILSAEFQDMSEDGQEKYGYHYNETIMNMLFNKYVTNDQGYQQKYLNSVPAEKKRRDKSGIHQLQQKGEEKMEKKSPQAEGGEMMDNNLNSGGGGTFDDREYLNHRIEKNYDTMEEPIKNNVDVDETTGAASSGAFTTALGAKNNVYENDDCEDCEEQIDETTTSASSGAFEGPFHKKGKDHVTNKPAWEGGKMIGENYLTDPSYFKRLHESFGEPNDDSLVGMAENNIVEYDMTNDKQVLQKNLKDTLAQMSGLLDNPSSEAKKSYEFMKSTAQNISQQLGVPFREPTKGGGNVMQQIGKFLGLREAEEDLSRDGMVRTIVGSGRYGDHDSVNRHDDNTLKSMYQNSKMADKSLAPDANRGMERGIGEDIELSEHHLNNKNDMVKFIMQNGRGKFGDIEMLNHQSDDVIKSIYNKVEQTMGSLDPEANRGMEKSIGEAEDVNEDLSKTVQYDSQRSGEEPFEMNGEKWQYVNAIYPDGKKDIGVYKFGHDLVYDFEWFNKTYIDKDVNENPLIGMAATAAGSAIGSKIGDKIMGEAQGGVDENTLNGIVQMLQQLLPKHSDQIEVYKNLAHSTVKTFFGGDYQKAFNAIKAKMGGLMSRSNEGILDTEGSARTAPNDGSSASETMKDTQMGGFDLVENKGDHDLKTHGRADDIGFANQNALGEFGVSREGYGGFNGEGDGDHPNYKDPSKFEAPRNGDLSKYNKMTEGKEAMCEDCGSQLDEDGHCRKDEFPVAGKIAGEKGSCRKKKTDDNRADDNKFNVEFRHKQEKERADNVEKKHTDYTKELENNKKHMTKLKEMVEGKDINEDKRPSALVQMDRLHKDNSKNFKADMKVGNTAQTQVDQDELTAKDQIEEVSDNPYDLAEKIEKEKIKEHEFNSLKNEGNSTNDDNKEIPKRNLTDDEAEDVMLNRGLGMQDIVYDNKPDERFDERMKKDMGDQIFDQREEKMKFRADAPMYNKDTQPVEKGTEETQFDKNISKFNNPKGIKENRIVAGKYIDDLGRIKIVNFNINEAVEVKADDVVGAKLNLEGMGNTYTQSVSENKDMRDMMDSWKFYMNAGKVTKVANGKQTLTEGEIKQPINEEVQKMLKLSGYKPSDYVDNSKTKMNAKFDFKKKL